MNKRARTPATYEAWLEKYTDEMWAKYPDTPRHKVKQQIECDRALAHLMGLCDEHCQSDHGPSGPSWINAEIEIRCAACSTVSVHEISVSDSNIKCSHCDTTYKVIISEVRT